MSNQPKVIIIKDYTTPDLIEKIKNDFPDFSIMTENEARLKGLLTDFPITARKALLEAEIIPVKNNYYDFQPGGLSKRAQRRLDERRAKKKKGNKGVFKNR